MSNVEPRTSPLLLFAWTALLGFSLVGQTRIGPLAAGEATAALLLAAFVSVLVARRGRWRRTPLDGLIAAWTLLSIAWCALGMHQQSVTPNPYEFVLYGGTAIGPLHLLLVQLAATAAYYLAVATRDAPKTETVEPLPTALEITALLAVVVCGIEASRVGGFSERIEAGFTNANLLGSYVVLLAPTLAARAVLGKSAPAPRIVRLVLFAGLVVALLHTHSRGAQAGMAMSVLGIVGAWGVQAAATQAFKRAAGAAAILAGIGALGLLAISHHGLADALNHSRSDAQRHVAWQAGCLITQGHLATGVGIGAFPAAMVGLGLRELNPDTPNGLPTIPARHLHAHNIVLQAGAERGMIGIAMLLVAGLLLLRIAPKIATSPSAIGAAAAIAGWTVQNMVDYTAWLPAVAILLGVQIGIMVAAGDRER